MPTYLDPNEFEVVASGGAVAPSAVELSPDEFEVVPERQKTGKGSSFLLGLQQGISLGFADEIRGAFGALGGLATGKDPIAEYKRGRDELRTLEKQSREDNPWTHLGGEITGSMATAAAPGLNVLKGATTGARVIKAAKIGGVEGLGRSEGEDLATITRDVAAGAGAGGLGGIVGEGAGKLIGGAAERVQKRLVQGITEGAAPSLQKKLVGRAGERRADLLELLGGEKAIKAAAEAGDGAKLTKAIADATEKAGTTRTAVYQAVDGLDRGVAPKAMMSRLDQIQRRLRASPETRTEAEGVFREMRGIFDSWGKRKAIPAEELRATVTGLQNDARAFYRAVQMGTQPPAAAESKAIVARELREMLHEHIERVAGKNPGKVPLKLDELKALNKRLALLSDLDDVAASKAMREATSPPRRLGWLTDVVLAVTEPGAFLAKKVLVDTGVAGALGRAADDKIAKLVQAAQAGKRGAQLQLMATQLGLSKATAGVIESKLARLMEQDPIELASEE